MKLWDKSLVRSSLLLSLAVFLSVILLSNYKYASAQRDDGPAQGLQVSPVLIDLNAEQGKSYTLKITVTNITSRELLVKPSVNDFKAKDESGNPEILTDGTSDASYSLRRWATVANSFTLKPKENRVISVFVNVPANAESGGHYGVVRFSAVPADAPDANVSISASVGSLILARIGGQIEEQLQVKELFVEKNGHKGVVFESTPQKIVERLENTGNVHLKPQGTAVVKNMFGKTVMTTDINKQGGNILPKSTRRFEQAIDKKMYFGKYTVELNATYGTHGGVLLSTSSFWVIPFKLIIVSLLLLILIVLLLKRGIKRYNKRVITRHHKAKQK
jgi:hypothetical protein